MTSRKRRFIDAPAEMRCVAVVTLKDGSTADCGRRRKVGCFCTQHARIFFEAGARLIRGEAR